jgi:proteasome-associated ATPase
MSDERHKGEREFDLLDRVDLLIATLPPGDALRRELLDLRMEICQREEVFVEARQTIEKLEEVIKKVTSPANRIGTFLGNVGKETAHIVVGGADYYCNVDPRIPIAKLKKGTRVLVNEAFVIVGDLGFEPAGPVTKVTEVIGTDRLRVGNEHGTQSLVLQRSAPLAKAALKQGDEVRVDSNYRMALEMMSAPTNIISITCRSCPGRKSADRSERSKRSRTRSSCRSCIRICSKNFTMQLRRGFCFTDHPGAARP